MSRFTEGEELVIELLAESETIKATISATQCDPPSSKTGKIVGCLAITDQRIIFAGRAITTKISRVIPLSQVTSLQVAKGMMLSHIQVTLAGSYENFLVKYNEAQDYLRTAQDELEKSRQANKSMQPTAGPTSQAEELAKLADLHRQGILTDTEFTQAKSRLLS
jgi:hypothetical protein